MPGATPDEKLKQLQLEVAEKERKERMDIALFRKTREAEPPSMTMLQNRKKAALEQERAKLKQEFEYRLALEQHQMQTRLIKELDIRDRDLRAASSTAPKYSSLGDLSTMRPEDIQHPTKEARINFKTATTDDIHGHSVQKVIGAVSGSYLQAPPEEDENGVEQITRLDRTQATDALTEAALRRGANAVVGLRYDTAPVGDYTEINAYGTAVVCVPTKEAGKGKGEKSEGGEGGKNKGGKGKDEESALKVLKRALSQDSIGKKGGKHPFKLSRDDDEISYSQIQAVMDLISRGRQQSSSSNNNSGWASSGWGDSAGGNTGSGWSTGQGASTSSWSTSNSGGGGWNDSTGAQSGWAKGSSSGNWGSADAGDGWPKADAGDNNISKQEWTSSSNQNSKPYNDPWTQNSGSNGWNEQSSSGNDGWGPSPSQNNSSNPSSGNWGGATGPAQDAWQTSTSWGTDAHDTGNQWSGQSNSAGRPSSNGNWANRSSPNSGRWQNGPRRDDHFNNIPGDVGAMLSTLLALSRSSAGRGTPSGQSEPMFSWESR